MTSPLDQRSGFHTPASREQEYSPVAGEDASFDTTIDSLPDSSVLGNLRRSQTADHHGPESQQLSPNDMIAPVSAVHSMSVNLLGSNDVSLPEWRFGLEAVTDPLRSLWNTRPMVTQGVTSLPGELLAKSVPGSCMNGMYEDPPIRRH